MTRTKRIAGGSLVLLAAPLTLIISIVSLIFAETLIQTVFRTTILVVGVVYLYAGILLIKDHNFGGIICLIAASVQMMAIFIQLGVGTSASFAFLIEPQVVAGGFDPTYGSLFFIDPALAVVGGILGLIAGAEL